jgi:repressor LexA
MELKGRAAEILRYIVDYQVDNGAPPTIREIGKAFAIRSTNGVCYYLDLLSGAGAIERRKGSARGIILNPELMNSMRDGEQEFGLPILGQIAAGGPVLAEENIEGQIDRERLQRSSASFALRVSGDSMRDAGILNGDLVMVRSDCTPQKGEIVVAMIGDETTVKRFRREGDRIFLDPENPDYEPIVVTASSPELRIIGKVVGVYREFG